ncbi:hypothetical protein P691DRAFT_725352 [Macrolepiota fuliginosa MF-IS2]|uniref:Uncharacterized protein n=1 Tax=Macrolepiota fuliginosa MF-IS2 TaxID=1400762 RepID=A0A9P6C6F5_9AGAR|nr:hypothetical protein P691DRAFT_725352 [Macrolepiota fuliginosa MF-IS2]
MDTLPLDVNHPAVRDFLALTRLQVLTPLSLVINLATVLVCSIVVKPSLGGVSGHRPTAISPSTPVIGIYILALYVMQVGYCVLLVLATKPETKKTLIKGVGLSLVFSNFLMAIWAITWVMEWFLVATILQGVMLILLLYSNIALLVYHPPDPSRPFDTALIHAPLRFFFILPFSLLFPLCLFITLGFVHNPAVSPGSDPDFSGWHVWPTFGVVLGTNIVGLIVVLLRRDIVWTVAATWICISIWSLRPKPVPIYATVIIFTALHPLALIAAELYHRFHKRQPIALPDDEEHPGLYRHQGEQERTRRESERAPRERAPGEVSSGDIWS